MVSGLFCLSSKGELIFHKKYRFDVVDNCVEVFRTKLQDGSPNTFLPQIHSSGVYYYHVKRANVYLIAASKSDQALQIIEILSKLYQLLKDFCGVFNEDSLKVNIILVYELLDEFIDYGHVQLSSTDKLKPYIQSDPITPRSNRIQQPTSGLFGVEYRAPAAANSADKPVVRSQTDQENRRDEIFLDVVERINLLMDANGELSRYELNGKVNMKCFLCAGGSPRIHISLNDDLQFGDEHGIQYGLSVSHYSLHDSVDKERFIEKRELVTAPPQGEFMALTYSLSNLSQSPPVRFYLNARDLPNRGREVAIKLRANIPDSAEVVSLNARILIPKFVHDLTTLTKGPNQALDYNQKDGYLMWNIKRLRGGNETLAKFRITGQKSGKTTDISSVLLDFEISGHVTSGLAIKYLRLSDPNGISAKPHRWIRYITVPDSYIVNVSWST